MLTIKRASGSKAFCRRTCVVGSQAISSASNLLLAVCVARANSPEDFGIFAIGYGLYWFSIACLRALVGETLLIFDSDELRSARQNASGAITLTLALAVGVGVTGAIPAALLSVDLLQVFAFAFPVLAVADALRYVFFAMGRPHVSLAIDACWLLLQVPAALILLEVHVADKIAWVLGWAIAALLASAFGCCFGAPKLSCTAMRAWFMTSRSLGVKAVGDFSVYSGTQQLLAVSVPMLSSLTALAAVRVGQVAAGPLNVAMSASAAVLLPVFSRHWRSGSRHSLIRSAKWSALGMLLLGSFTATAVIALPAAAGEFLFGASWAIAAAVAPIICIQAGLNGAVLVCTLALRATGNATEVLKARMVFVPVNIVLPVFGLFAWGEVGFAVGLLAAAGVAAAAWFWLLHREIGDGAAVTPALPARPPQN